MYVCVYIYISIYVYIYTSSYDMYVCVYVCVCIHARTSAAVTYIHTNTYTGYNQHDSQELLRFLIDAMQEGLLRPKLDPPFPFDDDQFDQRPVGEQSQRMWENYLARNDSQVSKKTLTTK